MNYESAGFKIQQGITEPQFIEDNNVNDNLVANMHLDIHKYNLRPKWWNSESS